MKPDSYSSFVRLRAVLFFLGSLIVSEVGGADPNRGAGMVRREFPEFYEAARENFGVHEANEFFERWTLAEISILHDNVAFIEERATLLRGDDSLFERWAQH